MKKIVLSLIIFLSLHGVHAQSLSIQEAYERLDQSLRYQQDQAQTQISREEYREILQNRLPVFYVDAQLQRNLITPTTPVPAIAFDPSAAEGDIIPLKFATNWSSRVGVQLEWNLFNPRRIAEEQEQLLTIEKAELQEQESAQDWKRDLTLAYASVVLATQQYEVALQDSATYAVILATSQARTEEGRELPASYLSAQQEFERKRIQLHEAWSVLVDADLELRRYVDLSETMHLSSDIAGITDFVSGPSQINYTLRSLEIDQQITQVQQQDTRRSLLPSLSFNGYIGEQFYSNELRLFQEGRWFGNSYVNLSLQIPLSAYITAQPTFRKLAQSYELQNLSIQEERRADEINRQQQTNQIKAVQQKLARLRQIAALSAELKELNEASYVAGRLLISDYNQSLSDHFQAQQDVWQAEYDLIQLMVESIAVEDSF